MHLFKGKKLMCFLLILTSCVILTELVLSFILRLKDYKNMLAIEPDNPPIVGFKAFELITQKNISKPLYNPLEDNLGFAGQLYLNCYLGICAIEKTGER